MKCVYYGIVAINGVSWGLMVCNMGTNGVHLGIKDSVKENHTA